MEFIPIKTRRMEPPQDNLFDVLDESLTDVQERDIVLITSKVVAIHQGRSVLVKDVPDKDALIRHEAERYIERPKDLPYPVMLTVKHHTLIATSGIDESNANNHYVLWPEHIDEIAKEIWRHVRNKHGLKNLGIILTDSHCIPLRWGVVGVSIASHGFEPLRDLRGKKDLFGRELTMTKQNVPDALAALGVHLMGESDESTPVLVVRGYSAEFTEEDVSDKLWVDPNEDIFKPLLDVFTNRGLAREPEAK